VAQVMTENGSPKMSVIILTPDRYETIRRTMTDLRNQTAYHDLEILIAAASVVGLSDGEQELAKFANVRVVEVGAMQSVAAARAAAVLKAGAELVAFAEDHSYPDANWAEALIAAHRGPWAAVGPAICNANPRSALSWANLSLEYGPWLHPVHSGPVEHLPGHNSSYKRAILLEYGPQLESMLESETVLHWDLRARGYQLYLEASARTSHLNYSSLRAAIPLRFFAGRLFGASRANRWPAWRRFFYAMASPLIPLVRLPRALRDLRRANGPHLAMAVPWLIIVLTIDAVGEMFGYLFGSGDAMRKLSDMEFHRHRFLNRQDKRALGVTHNSVPVSE
jgi:hypothetical protein